MARTCTALSEYMTHARKMKQKYGMKTILLATDSQAVISATKHYPDFTFLSIDKFHHDTFTGKLRGLIWDQIVKRDVHSEELKPTSEAKQIIADMILLSQCSALIGTVVCCVCGNDFFILIGKFTSNVFRLAFQLMVAKSNGGMKPYVSLDSPWCSDFGFVQRMCFYELI